MSASVPAPPPSPASERERIAPLPRRLLAAGTDVGLVAVVALTVGLARVDLALDASLAEAIASALELATTMAVVTVVLGLAHEVVGIAVWGRTAGKWLFGLVVRRSDGDGPVGWVRAATRAGVPFVSGLAPMVGQLAPAVMYGWVLGDRERRQGLHDRAARTVVVCAS
jgi:uncharacterized RDD family membrane protein YckC